MLCCVVLLNNLFELNIDKILWLFCRLKMAEGDTTRMGRFRVCPPNSPGPPGEQLSHGRFRIIPQGNKFPVNEMQWWLCNGDEDLEQYEQFCPHSFAFREFLFLTIFRWESKCELDDFVFLLGTYGPTSPCVQRGRFAVIPEEPSSSPSVNDTNANERRTPSPDWDFAEVKWTNEKTIFTSYFYPTID